MRGSQITKTNTVTFRRGFVEHNWFILWLCDVPYTNDRPALYERKQIALKQPRK